MNFIQGIIFFYSNRCSYFEVIAVASQLFKVKMAVGSIKPQTALLYCSFLIINYSDLVVEKYC